MIQSKLGRNWVKRTSHCRDSMPPSVMCNRHIANPPDITLIDRAIYMEPHQHHRSTFQQFHLHVLSIGSVSVWPRWVIPGRVSEKKKKSGTRQHNQHEVPEHRTGWPDSKCDATAPLSSYLLPQNALSRFGRGWQISNGKYSAMRRKKSSCQKRCGVPPTSQLCRLLCHFHDSW